MPTPFASGFSGCCGANIVYGFGGTKTAGINRDIPVSDQDARKWLKSYFEYDNKAFTVVILNQDQKPRYHDMLLEYGFRCKSVGKYSGHKSTLSMYVFTRKKFK